MKKTTKTKQEIEFAERIADFKKEHFQVLEVHVGNKMALVAFPSWRTWKQAVAAVEKSSVAFAKAILSNGFLYGDEDIAKTDDDFLSLHRQFKEIIEFADAEVERKDNYYLIKVEDKVFKCRPVTIEIIDLSERANGENAPFVTNENILKRILIEGDDEVMRKKNPYYYVPLLTKVDTLFNKKMVSIKKH